MKAFDARAYSISDFQEWHNDKKLILSPKFQRRSVWSTTAKAFLADTIIRGKPFPKVIFMQKFEEGRTVRVVVDGQQRLRSILEFLDDGIKISRAHNSELAGKVFSELPDEIRDEFLSYEVGCDVLGNSPTSELLDIFARINRYSIKLNAQELRNANFSGFFKTRAFDLGYRWVDYWKDAKVLTQTAINRMGEAELSSDLLVAFLNGISSNKSIEAAYKTNEDSDDGLNEATDNLNRAIRFVAALYPEDELAVSSWRKKHLYYSLVTTIGVIQGANLITDFETQLTQDHLANTARLRAILGDIEEIHDTYSPQPKRAEAPLEYRDFIRNSTLATTDTRARQERLKFIVRHLEGELLA